MNFRLFSDLHLEWQYDSEFHPGEGDVLILAGDICTAYDFYKKTSLAKKYKKFFRTAAENYNKVFYVMGNHEHYDFTFEKTESVIRDNLPEGITLLQNQSEYYNGVHFVGATMWSDFENGDITSMAESQQRMNDYKIIHTIKNDRFSPLSPIFTLNEFTNTTKWFNQCIPMLRKGPVFMITHHAPCYGSFEGYRERSVMGAYASDMTPFMRKNPNIKWWAHGHIHATNDYMIEGCRVMSNPRGYYKYETNIAFDEQAAFNMETAI